MPMSWAISKARFAVATGLHGNSEMGDETATQQSIQINRAANRALFLKLIGHLGRKEFDDFEACLHPEFVQVWPYKPLPSMPDSLRGASAVRRLIEQGMS